MSAVYDDRSLRWVYDTYAKGKVKEMVNQYRMYFGRCDDVGSMVELHRLAKQKFATEDDFAALDSGSSQKTIDDAYKNLCVEVIVQALNDYYGARLRNDDEEVRKIEDWIKHGNFYLFYIGDYDEDFILKRFREYDGERISNAIKTYTKPNRSKEREDRTPHGKNRKSNSSHKRNTA